MRDILHKTIEKTVSVFLAISVFLMLFFPALPVQANVWYEDGSPATWHHRTKIVIPQGMVGSDLNDFPVYVDLSDLAVSPNFFSSVEASGGDIRVTETDGDTEFPVEVVSLDTGAQKGQLYFKADLDSSSDNVFYIYYGNSSATMPAPAATYGRNNVWSNNFASVWHMEVGNIVDSTGGGNGGTNQGSSGAGGPVGGARNFMRSQTDYIDISPEPTGSTQAPFTYSTWFSSGIQAPAPILLQTSEQQFIIGNGAHVNVPGASIFTADKSAGLGLLGIPLGPNPPPTLHFAVQGNGLNVNIGTGYTANDLVHVAGVWDGTSGSNAVKLYVGGSLVVQGTAGAQADQSGFGDLTLGTPDNSKGQGTFDLQGLMDEVRISSTVRSADWIAASYQNQNTPNSFYTIGPEQNNPATVSCTVSTSSSDFGTLAPNAISIASPNITLTSTCQNFNGCILRVKDAGDGSDGGIFSMALSHLIESVTETLSAGNEGYGIQIAATGAGSGEALDLDARYDKNGNAVGGLSPSGALLASSDGMYTNREVTVTHKATINPTTPAGSYGDTVTYSCLVN